MPRDRLLSNISPVNISIQGSTNRMPIVYGAETVTVLGVRSAAFLQS